MDLVSPLLFAGEFSDHFDFNKKVLTMTKAQTFAVDAAYTLPILVRGCEVSYF